MPGSLAVAEDVMVAASLVEGWRLIGSDRAAGHRLIDTRII